MTRFVAAAGAILSLSMTRPSVGVGQEFCRRALADRPFPQLRNGTAPPQSTNLYSVVWGLSLARSLRVDSVSRGLIKNSGGYTFAELYLDSAAIPQSIRSRAPADSAGRWHVAFQIADLFNAGDAGATEGMAYAAASLYK